MPKRHQQQKYADDPGQLAGELVGSEQRHLHHVDEHDGDHEVRAPAMYGAQEPSQRDAVIQVLQAVPGFSGGWHVDQRQHDAGEDLDDEDGERSAAEDIEPARRLGRHRMLHGRAHEWRDLQALLEPVANLLYQPWHPMLPSRRLAVVDNVGSCPASIIKWPPSTL